MRNEESFKIASREYSTDTSVSDSKRSHTIDDMSACNKGNKPNFQNFQFDTYNQQSPKQSTPSSALLPTPLNLNSLMKDNGTNNLPNHSSHPNHCNINPIRPTPLIKKNQTTSNPIAIPSRDQASNDAEENDEWPADYQKYAMSIKDPEFLATSALEHVKATANMLPGKKQLFYYTLVSRKVQSERDKARDRAVKEMIG